VIVPRELSTGPSTGDHLDPAPDEEGVWRLAKALASSTTPIEVAESLAQEGGSAAGGSFANMAMLEPGGERVRVVHHSTLRPVRSAQWSTIALADQTPASEAMRTGAVVLLRSTEEIAARFPHLLAEIQDAGLSARASLPLRSESGAIFGVVGFGWPRPQQFSPGQLRRLDLIAELAGLSLERSMQRDPAPWLPSALETMPSAILSIDIDFRIAYVNAEGVRLLGAIREELVGRTVCDVFPGASFARHFRQAMQAGHPVTFDEYHVAGECWLEIWTWPDAAGLNLSVANISARREQERAREEALREAELENLRLNFLSELSISLSGLSTRSEVFQRASHAVTRTMVGWCTIVVPAEEQLVRVAASHHDPTLDALAKRLVGNYPHHFSGPSPGVVVYRSGQSLRLSRLVTEISEKLDDSFASAAYGRALEHLGDGPGLITPVISRGEVVAVITTVRVEGVDFSDVEVTSMLGVAARVAHALEEADLIGSQRETVKALQAAALPATLPTAPGVQLAAGYRPASRGSQIGGDWYDAVELSNERLALVVGDAAGHGTQAAALMAQLRNALRANLFASFGPAESLLRLGHLIARENSDAFATVICAELNPVSGEMTWASAGHPAPILVSGDGTATHLRGRPSPPIGWAAAQSSEPAIEHHLCLQPGDRLLIFTDGLIERPAIDLEIGLTHLMILAEQTRLHADAADACEAILRDILATSHRDDVCLLIIDFKPGEDPH
jgi:PAS domain S-box-containing protein